MSGSETELIARVIVDDDRAAFGDLVRLHQSRVRRFLRHLTSGDAAWADDLAQETFIQAYRGLTRFRGDAQFSTWLLGIAYNRFRNARRHRHESPREFAPEPNDSYELSPTRATDLGQDLAAALQQLSVDEQTVLHVCYQQGLSHYEAAAMLGWPIGTVKTHVARGKTKLRQLLAVWNPQT